MSDEKLENYKSALAPLPKKMLRWHLYGAGLENLGKKGSPEEVEVPTYGSEELLVRQDACGLCFSDTKVIGLGPNHPRMTGRDLAADPVTLGHEVACTVVGVGENLKDRFHVGDRFVIQADVFYQGKSMAYGYAISGGLAEYSVIPRAVIEGDEGCYLLPIRPDTGYVESALTEPWACVVSAYAQSHRDGIKPEGITLVIGSGEALGRDYDWEGLLSPTRKPRHLVAWNLNGKARAGLLARTTALSIAVTTLESSDLNVMRAAFRENGGVDDIVILGHVVPEIVEFAAGMLADHAILNIVSDRPLSRKLSLDIGRIHYNWHYYLGTDTARPADAYQETRTADLLPGGLAWFIGAGGPMGQMHVQRAVQHRQPPRRIVATDVDSVRLQSVADRFGKTAQECGIALITLNPREMGEEAFHAELKRLGEGKGFDDIISMVPVAALIEHAADYLAPCGWFNIFAGVARGTMANLDMNQIVQNRCRFLGSSGSSLADMRATLARVENDELSTNASLAAIGGMEAAKEGLLGVKEGWFPGKTLIFPLIHNLSLTPLPELKEKFPTVYAKLKDGQFWTVEAEEELLRLLLPKPSNALEKEQTDNGR
jgi:threonine dehydrogenase-like Zn-dependent dehydrogenase